MFSPSVYPNQSGHVKKETSGSAFIPSIRSIHVRRISSSVFLCALCGKSFLLFSAPLREHYVVQCLFSRSIDLMIDGIAGADRSDAHTNLVPKGPNE